MKNLVFFKLILIFSLFGVPVVADRLEIELAGNAFITKRGSKKSPEVITNDGLANFIDPKSVCSVYFKTTVPETFKAALKVTQHGTSKIKVSIGDVSYKVSITDDSTTYEIDVGTFTVPNPGYVKLDIQGVPNSKSGTYYADVELLILYNTTGTVYFLSPPTNFIFGRRGPSVHLEYNPHSSKTEYFYGELTVPKGEDIVGSYFMRCGFSNGYFGMQRLTKKKKIFLFSVFADFKINNPGDVKKENRVRVLRKGESIMVEDFGGEGSGKKTMRTFPWKTEEIYKFLVKGVPTENGTKYTGWFSPPGSDWQLMATIYKPKAPTYLTDLYSFVENFEPDQGYISRKALFGNEWVYHDHKWKEMTTATYTGDDTAMKGREDLSGGLTDNHKQFYLKMGGFFNEKVQPPADFTRTATKTPPNVDFSKLP